MTNYWYRQGYRQEYTTLQTAFLVVILFFFSLLIYLPPATAENADAYVDNSHPKATLIIGSKNLLNRVKIIEPKFRKIGRLSQCAITIKNSSKERYSLEYKIDWQSEDGFPTQDKSVWQRFVLNPFAIKTFTSIGKDKRSEKIVATVRFPDDAFIELDNRK